MLPSAEARLISGQNLHSVATSEHPKAASGVQWFNLLVNDKTRPWPVADMMDLRHAAEVYCWCAMRNPPVSCPSKTLLKIFPSQCSVCEEHCDCDGNSRKARISER
ncbi:hypothetical protein MTO96_014927 [Rhipicephalus appendiculatus]